MPISRSVTYEHSYLPFIYPGQEVDEDEPPQRKSGLRVFKHGKEVEVRVQALRTVCTLLQLPAA